MYRLFEEKLKTWKNMDNKRPLVVLGVRQCGKSYIIDKFCKENFKKYVEINLLKDEKLINIYTNVNSYKNRKELLCTTYNLDFNDENTILFVDEAQLCPKFITDLKNFCEDGINNIILAGSLLTITLRDMEEPYPVGKTHLEHLYPMNFEEYLYAIGKENYISYIKDSFEKNIACPLHEELMELFRKYLYVGGMPANLQNYLDTEKDISKMDKTILNDIKEEYRMDIVKHIKNDKDKLRAQNIYKNIAPQLMKENPKFMYAKFDNKERKADYISALDWLINSGMVIKCNQITNSLYPIKAYEDDNNYKLYLSDIGLLRDIINATSIDVLMEGDYPYKGVLTENYVALELLKQFGELFYWTKKNDGQGNKSEVDFIVQINDKIVPIEVKSNKNQAKSLKEYNDLFHPELMIKVGNYNFGYKDNIKTIPLYAVFLIKDLLVKS